MNRHLPGILFALCAAFPAAAQTFTLWRNAVIYTVNPNSPRAESMVTSDGVIVAVGSEKSLENFAASDRTVVDLKGQTVVPGLIDAHVHLMNLGEAMLTLDVTGTESYEQIVRMAHERAAAAPEGEWILGRGWDQNDWREKDFPHHEALSAATPRHPVSLRRIDGHALFVNAAALAIAGIDGGTPDPEGGRILRDDSGAPTGVLIDAAMDLIERHVPDSTESHRREAVSLAIGECAKYGLTSVHEAGVSGSQIELYKRMIDDGAFNVRVYGMIRADETETWQRYFAQGPLIGYGGGRLTVRSVKAYADGALGSRGAALLQEYSDDPGNRGLMLMSPAQLSALSEAAAHAGFQVCTHAIGDRGNRDALDAYAAGFGDRPALADYRFRIEHAQVVALEDIPRFAALGVIPSMQATHATSDMYWAEDRVGPERVHGAYAWRKFLDAGCRIANGSDFPVEGVNPLWGFYAAITRQDKTGWPEGGWHPEECMTREEALRSFTIDAAYAAFEENVKGSLEPGKLADFVVLDQDIMTIEPSEILETSVYMTVLDGRPVYTAGDAP